MPKRKIIVGISGATGAQMGYRLLQALRDVPDVETHLIISDGARVIFDRECDVTAADAEALADVVYDNHDLACGLPTSAARRGAASCSCRARCRSTRPTCATCCRLRRTDT